MNLMIDDRKSRYYRNFGGRAAFWIATVICLLSLSPRVMAAPPLCVPQANGVPALGGPPNWFNGCSGPSCPLGSVLEPQYWPRLDDPRWRGALAKSWGTGSSEHVQFRALRDADALYLSWWVKVDPRLTVTDQLYVAFSPGSVLEGPEIPDELITITPFASVSSNIQAKAPFAVSVQRRDSVSHKFGDAVDPTPTWLGSSGKTKVWLNAGEQMWAVNMVVPVTNNANNGINLQTNFKMWFEVQVSSYDKQNNPALISYTLNSVTLSDVANGTDGTSWVDMSLGTTNCAKAISIESDDIGTTNTDAGGTARPNLISLTGTNTFFARPKNDSGSTIAAGQLCAQFRIANWGTQPDWNNVSNPTTSLWKLISKECGLPGQLTNTTQIPSGTKGEITFPWTLTHDEKCEFIGKDGAPAEWALPAIPGDPSCSNQSPLHRRHECMLVELSAAGVGGGTLTFTQSSVYRNMDFVNASHFEREAEISVAGLANLPGSTQRDVYLYVKTLNMGSGPNPMMRDLAKRESIENRDGGGEGSGGDGYGGKVNRIAGRQGMKELGGRSPNDPFDVLEQVLPNYVVHAYHDTGKTVTRNGVTMKLMEPQSSFGYYVLHDGPLHSWSDSLAGAQQIAANYYWIGVPQGGRAVVKTQITAHETAPCSGGCCCRGSASTKTTPSKVATLGLVGLVGVVVCRRRRRR